jgi:hypothetical protein
MIRFGPAEAGQRQLWLSPVEEEGRTGSGGQWGGPASCSPTVACGRSCSRLPQSSSCSRRRATSSPTRTLRPGWRIEALPLRRGGGCRGHVCTADAASPRMHSADPVAALSEAASARAVIRADVVEGCSWLGGGGGSGAHSAGGGAGGGDVEGLGHAARC